MGTGPAFPYTVAPMSDFADIRACVREVEFERLGLARRVLKAVVIHPVANHLPARWLRWLLHFGKSELAAANWADPGGWRSMVISYEGDPPQVADRILVGGGSMSMALRNRRRLAARLLACLIDRTDPPPAHVLCLGAGPGRIIMDAMHLARTDAVATMVDRSSDAFDYGREQARREGLAEKVRFVQADVRDVGGMLDHPPDLVKMLGICEYLTDEQILDIARAVVAVMPPGGAIVFNSLDETHGTDRFFRRVFGLEMHHRSPVEIESLMRQAGFGEFAAFAEPLGVYHVLVGRKPAAPGE